MTAARDDELRGGIEPLLFPRSLAIVGASERNPRPIEGARRGGAPVYLVNPNRTRGCRRALLSRASRRCPRLPRSRCCSSATRASRRPSTDALAAGVRALVVPGIGAEAGAEGPPVVAPRARRSLDAAGAAVDRAELHGRRQPGRPVDLDRDGAGDRSCPATSRSSPSPARSARRSSPAARASASAPSSRRGGELNRDAADLARLPRRATRGRARSGSSSRRCAGRPRSPRRSSAAPRPEKPVVCLKVGRSEARGAGDARPHRCARRLGPRVLGAAPPLRRDRGGRLPRPARDPRGARPPAPAARDRGSPPISESGGECALLADHGEAAGLPFEPLPEELAAARCTAEFPNFVSPENPLDAWAIADENVVYPRSLELLAGVGRLRHPARAGRPLPVPRRGRGRLVRDGRPLPSPTPSRARRSSRRSPRCTRPTRRPESPRSRASATCPLLRGTGHALRALAAVARWRPARPPASDRAPVDLGRAARGTGRAPRARVGRDPRALRRAARPAPARRHARGGRPRPRPSSASRSSSRSTGRRTRRRRRRRPRHRERRTRPRRRPSDSAAASSSRGRCRPGPRRSAGWRATPTTAPCWPSASAASAVEALSLAAVALAPLDLDGARALVAGRAGARRRSACRTARARGRSPAGRVASIRCLGDEPRRRRTPEIAAPSTCNPPASSAPGRRDAPSTRLVSSTEGELA